MVAFVGLLALLLSACGGGSSGGSSGAVIDLTQESTIGDTDTGDTGDSGATGDTGSNSGAAGDTGADEPTAEPVDEPTPEPVQEEKGIEDVQQSTIRIAVQGTVQPVGEEGELVSAWSGTGFFIDESGLAVTNNHVVTGSAFLEVTIPGVEGTKNAVVLGVSECSDLAVIDVEGEGYEPLEFRTDPVNPGLSVFATGYPGSGLDGGQIENRDYTVTGGVVSNTTGTGDTQSSSVETVIEHDAKIRGGNSGGPLVDEQARVVGINYFGGDTDDFNLAIAAQEALPLIEQLKSGSVETIGVNGEAIVVDDFSGVWVQGVKSGSPADNAGVLPGDIILSMEGLPMALDGTMASYCDVVRSHQPTDVIDLRVLRLSTGEELEGQLNGTPLATVFSFATEIADDMGDTADGPAITGEEYAAFDFIVDDTDQVGVEVPSAWSDRSGTNDGFGPSVIAAPSIDGFLNSWDVPGIIVEINADLTPDDHDAVLDLLDLPACTNQGRDDFSTDDGFWVGRWELFDGCGGTETLLISVAASPQAGGPVARMIVQIVDPIDISALDRALATFDVSN